MKKLGMILGGVCTGALAASLIPFRVKLDREKGAFEIGSLLWSLKKTPGEERDTYTFELLPLFGSAERKEADGPAQTGNE